MWIFGVTDLVFKREISISFWPCDDSVRSVSFLSKRCVFHYIREDAAVIDPEGHKKRHTERERRRLATSSDPMIMGDAHYDCIRAVARIRIHYITLTATIKRYSVLGAVRF